MLAIGLEAMDETASIAEIEALASTGRPLASAEWIAEAERTINRKLSPAKRGPRPVVSHFEICPPAHSPRYLPRAHLCLAQSLEQ